MLTKEQVIKEVLEICKTPKTNEEVEELLNKISNGPDENFAKFLERSARDIRHGNKLKVIRQINKYISNNIIDKDERLYYFNRIVSEGFIKLTQVNGEIKLVSPSYIEE